MAAQPHPSKTTLLPTSPSPLSAFSFPSPGLYSNPGPIQVADSCANDIKLPNSKPAFRLFRLFFKQSKSIRSLSNLTDKFRNKMCKGLPVGGAARCSVETSKACLLVAAHGGVTRLGFLIRPRW